MSSALGALGIEHELEYLTAVNLLSVDIAIVSGGEVLARMPVLLAVRASEPGKQAGLVLLLVSAAGLGSVSLQWPAVRWVSGDNGGSQACLGLYAARAPE